MAWRHHYLATPLDSREVKAAFSFGPDATARLHHFYVNGSAYPKYSQAAPLSQAEEFTVVSSEAGRSLLDLTITFMVGLCSCRPCAEECPALPQARPMTL